MRAGFAGQFATNPDSQGTTTMADLNGQRGFELPQRQRTGSRRRQAITIELLATATLTVSLVVAATAVSMGNKLLTRGDLLERPPMHTPLPQR
ncbi:MAG: hypothetical protein ABSG46_19010 [Candidatus Binataceae bacterium]